MNLWYREWFTCGERHLWVLWTCTMPRYDKAIHILCILYIVSYFFILHAYCTWTKGLEDRNHLVPPQVLLGCERF